MTKPLDLEQLAAEVLATASAVKGDDARRRDVLALLERVRANAAAVDVATWQRELDAARAETAQLQRRLDAIGRRPTGLTEKP